MTSHGAKDVTGRRHEGNSTNPWSKLVIAGTVGGACAVFTACLVLSILVCRRWLRDKRAARRRRLSRRQRTASTNSSTVRYSSTPSVCSGRHTLPALPGKDLSLPLPPDVAVNHGAMTWLNQPRRQLVLDCTTDNHQRDWHDAVRSSPFVVDVPPSLRRSSTSSVTELTLNSTPQENVFDSIWSSTALSVERFNGDTTAQHYTTSHPLASRQANFVNTTSPYIHRYGRESDRWRTETSPVNNDASTDVNFNLSRYMIQQKNDAKTRQRAGNWRSSRSADPAAINRNWRRADVVDDTPTRERNTWELTQRSPNFPVRLIAGDRAQNGEDVAAVDSSDEEVWIPRLPKHTPRPRVQDAMCTRQNGSQLKSSACGDVLRTRTNRPITSQLCSTRS